MDQQDDSCCKNQHNINMDSESSNYVQQNPSQDNSTLPYSPPPLQEAPPNLPEQNGELSPEQYQYQYPTPQQQYLQYPMPPNAYPYPYPYPDPNNIPQANFPYVEQIAHERRPIRVKCPHCGLIGLTRVEREAGSCQILGGVLCCLCLGLIGLAIACLCCEDWADSIHYCSHCGRIIKRVSGG